MGENKIKKEKLEMKNTSKKGFTLVELVIVIAVIAVLAAVLIPTFTSVINRANQSAALQKIKAIVDEAYVDCIADEHKIPTSVVLSYDGSGDVASVEFTSAKTKEDYASTYKVFTFSTTGNSTVTLMVNGQEVYLNWTLNKGYQVETTKLVDTVLDGEAGTK